MTDPNAPLDELLCSDCDATMTQSEHPGLDGPVLTVAVGHRKTCPWLTRVAPEGSTRGTPYGVRIDYFRDDDE